MSEERRKYQPRGKKKSKMPFVLVGIVIAVGVAGFLILKDKPGKILPDKAVDAPGDESLRGQARDRDPSQKWVSAGAPENVSSGVIIPESTTAQKLPEDLLYEILVPKDAKALWINGKACDLHGLKKQLYLVAEMARDMKSSIRPSRTGVLVRADAGTRFREIQWVMQACADPAVRIYRIHWAVTDAKGEEAVLPVFLPVDRGIPRRASVQARIDEPPPEMLEEDIKPDIIDAKPIEKDDEVIEDPVIKDMIDDKPLGEIRDDLPFSEGGLVERFEIKIQLRRAKGEGATRIMFLDMSMGAGKFDALAERLKQVGARAPKTPCQIDASAEVPFGDVVRALDAARRAGFRGITFTGAPMPR